MSLSIEIASGESYNTIGLIRRSTCRLCKIIGLISRTHMLYNIAACE